MRATSCGSNSLIAEGDLRRQAGTVGRRVWGLGAELSSVRRSQVWVSVLVMRNFPLAHLAAFFTGHPRFVAVAEGDWYQQLSGMLGA